MIAWIVFTLSGGYLLRRRPRVAFLVGLAVMFFLGALLVQVRVPGDEPGPDLRQFADGNEVIVTAHVIKEGTPQEDSPGSLRQRLEVETEQITREGEDFPVRSGLRVNVYQQLPKDGSDQQEDTPVHFTYGDRLRFSANFLCHETTATRARSTTRDTYRKTEL